MAEMYRKSKIEKFVKRLEEQVSVTERNATQAASEVLKVQAEETKRIANEIRVEFGL